jgi:hypothetical protein
MRGRKSGFLHLHKTIAKDASLGLLQFLALESTPKGAEGPGHMLG